MESWDDIANPVTYEKVAEYPHTWTPLFTLDGNNTVSSTLPVSRNCVLLKVSIRYFYSSQLIYGGGTLVLWVLNTDILSLLIDFQGFKLSKRSLHLSGSKSDSVKIWQCEPQNLIKCDWSDHLVASELKDPIWHSPEWQIGSFSSEATIWYLKHLLFFPEVSEVELYQS